VLWGECDGWLDPKFGRALARAIPSASLTVVADGGHFLPEDQPRAVAEALASCFAETPAGTASNPPSRS
jgi:pimeloyl-ACP methyl ester carboxylesterase